jgi:hypothetical protein
MPSLRDGSALLGPLDGRWEVKAVRRTPFFLDEFDYRFLNSETELEQNEDPRLCTLESIGWATTGNEVSEDGSVCGCFREERTGQVLDSDPRLLPEYLRAQGVNLTTFSLV